MNAYNIIFGFITIANILLASVVVFLERRNIGATWAWLMILLFIPVLGFILYIIFGQNLSRRRIFKWDTKVEAYYHQALEEQKQKLRSPLYQIDHTLVHEYRELIYMFVNNSQALLTHNNQLTLFTDGFEKFDALLKDIAEAKQHIHLQYYIMRSDELGMRVCEALAERARAGVKVRVLYDDSGSRKLSRTFKQKIRDAGGEIVPFFPARIPFLNLRINYRNHRKLVIIDGKIGYLGGFNIGNEYLGLKQSFGYWRDTHLRIVGNAVNLIQSRFMLDWNQASGQAIPFKNYYYFVEEELGNVGLQIVSSGPDSAWEDIKNGYLKMILSAKQSIYLQTPYLIPDDSLLDALRIASLSGVDVRIMIPNKPDHPFVYWATYSYAGELIKAGVRIFTYEKGFLHAKTLVVDGKIASVGTANIDVRSFRLNFEVNAFIYHRETAKLLATSFREDIQFSKELTPAIYQQRSLWIKFKESISRLLSPIL